MEPINHQKDDAESRNPRWWHKLCLRCHQEDPTPSWQPSWWAKIFPFPFFPTYRQSAQRLCILLFCPLAIVSSGFVAAYFWEQQGWAINKNPVSNIFRIMWIFFEPILFAFTGAQITINALDPEVIKMGAICLLSCLVLRMIATFFVSFGCGLNKKEKLFIGVTWLAKATVQAALGPAALDLVNNGQSAGLPAEDEEHFAKTLLAVSVLSVVVSAPLGAILIAITGPRLLSQEPETNNQTNFETTGNTTSTPV